MREELMDMQRQEIIDYHKPSAQKNKIPTVLAVLGGIIFIINGIILGLYGLRVAVQIFEASLSVGLVMAFTGIGWIILAPAITAFGAFALFESIEDITNKFEYWIKAIGLFILGVLGPNILYLIVSFVSLLIASFIGNIVK
jgi:hypothetical protein